MAPCPGRRGGRLERLGAAPGEDHGPASRGERRATAGPMPLPAPVTRAISSRPGRLLDRRARPVGRFTALFFRPSEPIGPPAARHGTTLKKPRPAGSAGALRRSAAHGSSASCPSLATDFVVAPCIMDGLSCERAESLVGVRAGAAALTPFRSVQGSRVPASGRVVCVVWAGGRESRLRDGTTPRPRAGWCSQSAAAPLRRSSRSSCRRCRSCSDHLGMM